MEAMNREELAELVGVERHAAPPPPPANKLSRHRLCVWLPCSECRVTDPLPAITEAQRTRTDRDTEVLHLADLNWTANQIAAVLGESESAVVAALTRHGRRPPTEPDTGEEEHDA
jgi:hypothetical protein